MTVCGIEAAHHDFKDALSKSSGVGDKQAFHLIQSFAPGEVDFDTAHQVGIELADTPVVDESGNLTVATKEAIDLLDEYVRTFRERNPNLYLFILPNINSC